LGKPIGKTQSGNVKQHTKLETANKYNQPINRTFVVRVFFGNNSLMSTNKVSPRGRRDDMPPPIAVRSKNRGGSTAVRDESAVRTSLVAGGMAKLQIASVPIAWASAPWDRQTDRAVPKCPLQRGIRAVWRLSDKRDTAKTASNCPLFGENDKVQLQNTRESSK